MDEPVNQMMHARIVAQLRDIERDEGVRILFAIESGSRAWGFHSPDSDYDVRFVYARPMDWHFRLDSRRDVIERPIDDELDVSGWELGKALTLAMGSNAVIAEWLQSPICYVQTPDALAQLTSFCADILDRRAVTWHYLNLIKRQRTKLIGPDGHPRLKRYFYMLRPALALRWMRLNEQAMAPMHMQGLLAGCELNPVLSSEIAQLTEQKKQVREGFEARATVPLLDQLVADEEDRAKIWLASEAARPQRQDWSRANALHQRLSCV